MTRTHMLTRLLTLLLLCGFVASPLAYAQQTITMQSSAMVFGPTVGLTLHYTMDGPDVNFLTNVITDRSGTGNTGTLTAMNLRTTPTTGKHGQARL